MLKPQLTDMWIRALNPFVGSLVLGSVLMALGKIVEVLEDQLKATKNLQKTLKDITSK
ncbi:hypothetical protein GCM10011351_14720 [Paraliobacillus quinghaiensis]|uniref:Uncharacterized protein n=1 Tax=Paraliobacillus quinghaiensis TaxID=470815 RepID=A0A917TMX6_9BACI|nr:hypothetical protein [Paraliobacillus quinghaiensis]GGM29638.1 hypothetical protein GCM10011351_14720 [Paraliobacillus quinghaiensis]